MNNTPPLQPDDELRTRVKALVWGDGKVADTNTDRVMQLIAAEIRKARLGERKAVALDNYQGHTFSDSTNWEGKFQKFIDNNERRISQLTKPGEDTVRG